MKKLRRSHGLSPGVDRSARPSFPNDVPRAYIHAIYPSFAVTRRISSSSLLPLSLNAAAAAPVQQHHQQQPHHPHQQQPHHQEQYQQHHAQEAEEHEEEEEEEEEGDATSRVLQRLAEGSPSVHSDEPAMFVNDRREGVTLSEWLEEQKALDSVKPLAGSRARRVSNKASFQFVIFYLAAFSAASHLSDMKSNRAVTAHGYLGGSGSTPQAFYVMEFLLLFSLVVLAVSTHQQNWLGVILAAATVMGTGVGLLVIDAQDAATLSSLYNDDFDAFRRATGVDSVDKADFYLVNNVLWIFIDFVVILILSLFACIHSFGLEGGRNPFAKQRKKKHSLVGSPPPGKKHGGRTFQTPSEKLDRKEREYEKEQRRQKR